LINYYCPMRNLRSAWRQSLNTSVPFPDDFSSQQVEPFEARSSTIVIE
jgi:hypothetical protein